LAAAAAVALGVAAAAYGLYAASRARCFVLTGHTLCRVETTAPLVALTFDDGPTATGLEAVLPALQAHDAHATFFLIGADAQRHPDMVRALLASGHEVGNHSWRHVRMVGHAAAFYDAEIARTNAALRAAGAAPTLFRPPYGKKLIGLPRAVERAGMTMVTWDVEDPVTRDPQAFARQVVAEARPGSIILVHAMYRSNTTARAALPAILDGLAAKGLKVVSVGELRAAARPIP
jgi:peptidoglycan/xylan/chitin deacetylase (PgdA/CDA1 family)